MKVGDKSTFRSSCLRTSFRDPLKTLKESCSNTTLRAFQGPCQGFLTEEFKASLKVLRRLPSVLHLLDPLVSLG